MLYLRRGLFLCANVAGYLAANLTGRAEGGNGLGRSNPARRDFSRDCNLRPCDPLTMLRLLTCGNAVRALTTFTLNMLRLQAGQCRLNPQLL